MYEIKLSVRRNKCLRLLKNQFKLRFCEILNYQGPDSKKKVDTFPADQLNNSLQTENFGLRHGSENRNLYFAKK